MSSGESKRPRSTARAQRDGTGAPGECPQVPAEVTRAGGDGHGAKTDALKERAILAVLSESTIRKAAKRSGVHERTLRRWMLEDEEFRAALDEARKAAFELGINRIQLLTERAVAALEELLGADAGPAVRLGAVRTVMELALHRHESETLSRQIHELEQRQLGAERRDR